MQRSLIQSPDRGKSLPGRNNCIMVCNLLVIDITCLRDILITALLKNSLCKNPDGWNVLQSADIPMYLLRHCRRKDAGVCPGISHEFFLVQFLHNLQRLIGTYFKQARTIVLQLCQIIKQDGLQNVWKVLNTFYIPLAVKQKKKIKKRLY